MAQLDATVTTVHAEQEVPKDPKERPDARVPEDTEDTEVPEDVKDLREDPDQAKKSSLRSSRRSKFYTKNSLHLKPESPNSES